MTAETLKEIKDTFLWGGRLIVGSAVLYVCSTIMNDHEAISDLRTRMAMVEYKTKDLKGALPFCPKPILFTSKLVAILPDDFQMPKKDNEE